MKSLYITIEDDLHRKFKDECWKRRISIRKAIKELMESFSKGLWQVGEDGEGEISLIEGEECEDILPTLPTNILNESPLVPDPSEIEEHEKSHGKKGIVSERKFRIRGYPGKIFDEDLVEAYLRNGLVKKDDVEEIK